MHFQPKSSRSTSIFLLVLLVLSSCSAEKNSIDYPTEPIEDETSTLAPQQQSPERTETESPTLAPQQQSPQETGTENDEEGFGNAVFEGDQLITVELDFPQGDFFRTLNENYPSSKYIAADLTITDASGTHTYENVGVRLKGNSSMSHPGEKKPFKIDFNEFIVGQNHDGLKKLNFSNAFKDPSFLREKVFFDVSRSAGALAPRTNFANVYFNGELWGLYTVVEQIDDQFLDWTIGDDDGNLFKAGDDGADLRYLGLNQEAYEGVYEIKNNEEQNDWTDLLSLLDFVNDSSSEEFESQVEKYLDLDLFLRSAALDNLFSNLDSYTLSGRNYYLYHNMETDQWQWIKWDGNEAFGAFGYGVQESITELPVTFAGPGKILLERIFESAKLFQLYENEICGLLGTYFTPQYLHPMIDSLASLIESSVIMDENKMYSFQDFQSNINVDIVTEDPFLKEKEVRPGNTEWNPPQGNPPQGNQPPNREAPVMFGLKSFIDEKYAYLGQSLECESG